MNSRHSRPPASQRGPIAPLHRGPQAVSVPMLGTPIHHAPNAALLIDFDNVTMGIQKDLQQELRNLLSSDIIKGKVAVQRAYADWRRYPQYIVPLAESSIDMIMAPAYGSSKKNATDIRLAVDAMELVFTRPEIGTFILLSGDSDFSTLVIKLKEYGKYVIGVGIRESASDLLVMNCDEYYSYNALAGLVRSSDEEHKKYDPWELVSEAVSRMKRNGDVMRADRLKQVMQDIDASFDEKNLGMAKFSRFVQEAAHKGLLTLTKLDNGQFEIGPPHQLPALGAGAPAALPAASATAVADLDRSVNTVPVDERPRRDRGRGRGRGRDRDRDRVRDAEPRTGETGEFAVPAAATAAPAADVPARSAADRPRREPAAPAVARDEIGASGERLTRQEAFDLVRRAIEPLATGDEGVSARRVREQAYALLGRDSESLSERNFARILRDAHDGDVIDLRRRGDDYEVARAAEAAPVADQLNRAAAAAAPQPTAATPAAPRGMGHRGGGGRGGRGSPAGRAGAGAPPPDLLSIGVVEIEPAPQAAPAPSATRPAEAAPAPAPTGGDAEAPAGEERPAATKRGRGTRGGTRAAAKRAGRAASKTGARASGDDTAPTPAPEPTPVPEPEPTPEPAPDAAAEGDEGAARPRRPRRPRARKAAAPRSE